MTVQPAAAPAAPITFYFDFISPYAHIGWHQLRAIVERTGVAVALVPVLFAGLLDAHGTKGPAEVPAKRIYTFRDAYRKAHRLGLPALQPPPSHPVNPLVALRVASLPLPAADRQRLIGALFAATWSLGTGIETPAQVIAVANGVGLDGEALVAQANDPAIKQQLRDATAGAVARGVFGVPSVVVGEEIFWGTDGLDHVEACVRGEDPVPRDLSWAERPASAQRPGSR